MSSFTSPLIVEIEQGEREGRGLAIVREAFVYECGFLGSGDTVTVPIGFETDFASIPRFAMPLIPILGRHAKAAVLHDYLWSLGLRKIANRLFLESMTVLGVPRWRKWIMYAAVVIRSIRP